jgi:carbamoyltransferase
LIGWYNYLKKPRSVVGNDMQKGSYLGPEFSNDEILDFLNKKEISFSKVNNDDIPSKIAGLISEEKVIGWFQGRMEFGPRALGARSIIGDARSPKMQAQMNLKIKFREGFRPFAPSVLADKVSDYFEMNAESPYMLLVADVKKERQKQMKDEEKKLFGIDKLNILRSDLPAVTHIDYSARIQTVHENTNKLYYDLIKKFDEEHNCAVIINTSFNVRGEPIVCTPEDAYKCFMRTHIDYLIMGNYLLDKKEQKDFKEEKDWRKEFQLD